MTPKFTDLVETPQGWEVTVTLSNGGRLTTANGSNRGIMDDGSETGVARFFLPKANGLQEGEG